MTSTSFAARPGDTSAGSQPKGTTAAASSSTSSNTASASTTTGAAAAAANTANTNINASSNSPSFNSDDTVLHAHRQSHNSSKLPAFRFADLRKDRISLPSLQQPAPLAAPFDTADPRQPSASAQNALHHSSSAQTLQDRDSSSSDSKHTAGAARTRSLKFHLPPTSASADSSPASKRPASFPLNGAPSTQSPVPSIVVIPALKRRLTESAVKDSAPGRRELPLPKSADKDSRPADAADATSAASTSGARAVIPPIRSFRSSGSRKSAVPDMPSRQDSYGEDFRGANPRDRSLRTLEGQRDDDFSHLAPCESGEMTTTTDNDNTADIFMKIAREDQPRRSLDRQSTVTAEPSPSAIVSVFFFFSSAFFSEAQPSHPGLDG
jgi:hypothetical protein